MELLLASQSPRRRELLALITPNFQVVVRETEESVEPGTPPDRAVELLARRKARAVFRERRNCRVIGADTVVAVDGEILGKPASEAEAAAMLARLSGRWHTVYTGVAILDPTGEEAFVQAAEVEFAPLTPAKIRAYVDTGEPMDKAGAYGIQGKGALLVRGIRGDFYTVMGLPVCKLAEKLEKMEPFA